MSKRQLIALWSVIIVFCCTIYLSAGTVLWGSLGVFRPGDPGVTATTLPRATAELLINRFQQGHSRIWQIMTVGTMVLLALAVSATAKSFLDSALNRDSTD